MSEADKYLTLVAPERVQDNIYNQEPFEPVIANASISTVTNNTVVRSMLTYVIRSFPVEKIDSQLENPDILRTRNNQVLRAGIKRYGDSVDRLADYCQALGLIYTDLEEYPYWIQYLKLFLNNSYRASGDINTYKVAGGSESSDPSYARWVTREVPSILRSQLAGIDTVLPDSFPADSLRPENVRPNRTRIRQKWSILKASEIIPEKRNK